MVEKPKTKNMYLNKREMFTAIVKYKTLCADADEAERERPRIPEYLGGCFMMIARGIGSKRNFAGYQFIEDMIMDSVENCLMALNSFDPDKSDNPYGYFTKVVWWAFLRRIDKEKKLLYAKHRATENFIINNPEIMESEGTPEDKARKSLENAYMQDLARKFEARDAESKKKRAEKKRPARKDNVVEFEIEVETRRRKKKDDGPMGYGKLSHYDKEGKS